MKRTPKFIASTMTFRSSTLEYALTRLKANGFDNVEICSVDDWIPHVDFRHINDVQIDYIAAMVKRIGVNVININVGVRCLDAQKNNIGSTELGMVNNIMKLAKALNAQLVTIAADGLPENMDINKRVKTSAKMNKIMADIADFYGITLAVEAPHKLTIAESAEQIKNFWDAQDPRIKCALDCAHLLYAGEDLLKTVELYKDRIYHVQLRDSVKGNSLLKYGEGDVDFAAFINKLKECGYDRYYSLEYPCDSEQESEERLKESISFFEKLDVEM